MSGEEAAQKHKANTSKEEEQQVLFVQGVEVHELLRRGVVHEVSGGSIMVALHWCGLPTSGPLCLQ